MSKVLIISDVHFHRWNYGATVTKDGFNSRLRGQLNYFYGLRDIAVDRGVKHVICLGDLFHTNSTIHAEVAATAWRTVTAFANQGIKFHCLVGNHDMASKDGKIHSLDWLRSYGILVDQPMSFILDGRHIAAMPYSENAEQLTSFLSNPRYRHELVLLHQGVNLHDRGSAWVINEIFTKEMVPENVKLVLTGHYHRPVDDGKISIVGSPMEHNWSDCDNSARGCMILDLDTLETERIVNNYSPRFIKVKYGERVNVENKFVRVIDVPRDKIATTQEELLGYDAVSVECEILSKDEKKEVTPVFTSFEQVVQEYDAAAEGRRREVGKLLRDSMYETPNIQG